MSAGRPFAGVSAVNLHYGGWGFDHPGIRVFAASPEHLLAMKAFAARPRDTKDIRELVRMLDLHTVNDVLASVRAIFPKKNRRSGSGFC